MSDDLITHAEVMQWLSRDVQRALTMALPPEQRGWYTEEEAWADGGRFVETRRMDEAEPRFYRVSA